MYMNNSHKLLKILENVDMQLPQKMTVLNRHNVGQMLLLTPNILMQSAIKFNINDT
jgi:hypothetical protein